MGPMLMTGLACFGGAIGIGLLSTGSLPEVRPQTSRRSPTGRSLALIMLAFCTGAATLGTVVGLLAIFIAGAVPKPEYGLLAAGPAIAGGLTGIILIARHWRVGDRKFLVVAGLYVLGPAVLGSVVALLAVFITDVPSHQLSDWPFVILGLISGASALGIGATGAEAVRAMHDVDEPTAKSISGAQIVRSTFLEVGFVGASVVAIALVILS